MHSWLGILLRAITSPQKCPLPCGDLYANLRNRSLNPSVSPLQTASLSVQSFVHISPMCQHTHKDHATFDMCSNRPHLCTVCWRSGRGLETNQKRKPCKLYTYSLAIQVQLHSFLNWKLNAYTYVGYIQHMRQWCIMLNTIEQHFILHLNSTPNCSCTYNPDWGYFTGQIMLEPGYLSVDSILQSTTTNTSVRTLQIYEVYEKCNKCQSMNNKQQSTPILSI